MGGDIREAAAAYVRIAKRAAMMAGRYAMPNSSTATVDSCAFCAPALAGSFATYKIGGNADLKAVFAWPLSRADQIRSQQQRQRGWKLYSFHAPEVECIGRGKANAPYEFRCESFRRHHQCTGHRVANLFCTPGRCPAILMTAIRWAPSSKPLRGPPAARSSVPMSPRDTAATMPQLTYIGYPS